MHDGMILRGLLTNVDGKDVQIRKVHHVMPQCAEAEINIFIEVINPSLFVYAAKNIWIPNTEWTHKTHLPYLSMVDEVWVKTREAEELLSGTYIGWTSIDKTFCEKKNYHRAIALVGKNIYRNPKPILQAYFRIKQSNPDLYSDLPELFIPYDPANIKFHFPEELKDKVTLLDKVLSESEYDDLLKSCGLAICTSATEGFGHAVNEAMSSGCNLILSNI
jgi:glycosyltransferase involved in cell wall biosynthesis